MNTKMPAVAPAKRAYADSRFGQVHYTVGGSGAPVVLVAPSKRSSRVHAEVSALLAARYCVLCPDSLGFGNSDPLPPDASIEMLAEATLACLDAAGIGKAHFYGLHTGNKIVAAIAANTPERVDRLVLAGHTHSLIPDQVRRNTVIGDLVQAFLKPEAATDEAQRSLKAWATLYRRIAAEWWDESIFAGADTAAQLALAKRVILDYLQSSDSTVALYEANFRYDLGADMRRILAPTLVLEIATPDEDRDIGRQAQSVQALIAGSIIATLHEAGGHTHTLEHRAADLAAVLGEFFG
jgi:pimeloyl-ACP methyl ester carboxylesterase